MRRILWTLFLSLIIVLSACSTNSNPTIPQNSIVINNDSINICLAPNSTDINPITPVCAIWQESDNNACINIYETNSKDIKLFYSLAESLNLTVYEGVYDYLDSLSYENNFISEYISENYYGDNMLFISDPIQDEYMAPLIEKIQALSPNDTDRQVFNAIKLVQKISYDYSVDTSYKYKEKWPYQVLYEQKGACAEKSVLLVYILKKLGYGSSIMVFEDASHAAVGIKCPKQFMYKDTGYCFVETTNTFDIASGTSQLFTMNLDSGAKPHLIKFSEGKSLSRLNTLSGTLSGTID